MEAKQTAAGTVHGKRRKIFTLIFGTVALIFAIVSFNFAIVITVLGFSSIFSGKGIFAVATCITGAYSNGTIGLLLSILSQKLGFACGMNKTSLALSIASMGSSTIIFCTQLILYAFA
ncbi:MAG: hypothetical protein ACI4GZ_03315 [Ruminococcus sp.]